MTAQQLRNSILQMAVQGKLVPQDPNDEPASVLLERIRAEKEKLIKEKKIKKEKNPSVIFRGADNTPYEKIGDEVRSLVDEVPFDIPDSWEWVRLGELFQHNTGKALNASNRTGQLKQYITTSNLYWDRFELDNLKEMHFSDSEVEKCTVVKGDLLVCEGGDIGRAAIWSYDYPMCIQNHIHRLRAYLPLCTRFFYYLFDLYKHAGWIGGKGIGIQGLSSNAIHSLLFPFPPLAEQYRIVDAIDTMQPYTDSYAIVESSLDKLNSTFPERLKKSILQEAVQGKLVPQDPSDEPAEALLERIRAEKQRLIKEGKIKKDKHESVIFRRDNSHYEKLNGTECCIDDELPFEIPESWVWVRWGSIAESIQYGYNAPAKQEGRIKMVRISDIHENTVAWSSVPFCDIDDSDISTYLLQPNDILFARTGGTVGKSFLVSEVPCESIYAGYLIRTRYSSLLSPQYLKYFMESPLYWQQLKSGTTATAQPNCNGQTLAKMLLPLPPAKEQLQIVEKLVRIFSIIESI